MNVTKIGITNYPGNMNFNGRTVNNTSRIQTLYEKALNNLQDEALFAIDEVKEKYCESPLSCEIAIDRIYDIYTQKVLELDERFFPTRVRRIRR